jgi:hypothetical protein
MLRVEGLGGSRSHVAAALFVMARPPQREHRRDWAQSDRLKRVEPMAATIGPTTTPLPRAIERGDHGNATFYLVNGPVGNADQPLCVAFPR